jgi:hypothetical protein
MQVLDHISKLAVRQRQQSRLELPIPAAGTQSRQPERNGGLALEAGCRPRHVRG